MKLYATTTSNRAMKGQGGDWLKIIIRNEHQHCIAYINVRNENKIDIDVLKEIQLDVQRPIQICTDDDAPKIKGEKQKGEITWQCKFCNKININNHFVCEKCNHNL